MAVAGGDEGTETPVVEVAIAAGPGEEVTDMEEFWVVFGDGLADKAIANGRRLASFEAARAEAERLAVKHAAPFLVLKCVGAARPPGADRLGRRGGTGPGGSDEPPLVRLRPTAGSATKSAVDPKNRGPR